LAMSMETAKEFHYQHGHHLDFSVAGHFTRYFARQLLARGLPPGVDLLKIDVPDTAKPTTPWRATSVSRQRYYHLVSRRDQNNDQVVDYEVNIQRDTLEPSSDIYAFGVDRLVSVTPMTIDLTAKIALESVSKFFNGTG
jgi:5'-nucleotidase